MPDQPTKPSLLVIPDTFSSSKGPTWAKNIPSAINDSTKNTVAEDFPTLGTPPAIDAQNHHRDVSVTTKRLRLELWGTCDQLFQSMTGLVNQKMDSIMAKPLDMPVEAVTSVLAKGSTASLDQYMHLFATYSRINSSKAVDLLMNWRKKSSDSCEIIISRRLAKEKPMVMNALDILRDRKSLCLNMIVLRTLIEMIELYGSKTFEPTLCKRLEDMAFSQLLSCEGEATLKTPIKKYNFDLFAEFLGELASYRFSHITDKFLLEFEKSSDHKESRYDILVLGMNYVTFTTYPVECFEECASFLESCSDVFSNTKNNKMRQAEAEVNMPFWSRAMKQMITKLDAIVLKTRNQSLYPLVSVNICALDYDNFQSKWFSQVELCLGRLKDKVYREDSMLSICQLVWVQIYRCTDETIPYSPLEQIFKTLFPPKKAIFPPETSLSFFVNFIFIIGSRFPAYCVKTFVLTLCTSEESSFEVSLDRIGIALRVWREIHIFRQTGWSRPPFPRKSFSLYCPTGRRVRNNPGLPPSTPAVMLTDEYISRHFFEDSLVRLNKQLGEIISNIHKIGEQNHELYVFCVKNALDCLPLVLPADMSDYHLADAITKFATFSNESISVAAQQAMIRLCEQDLDKHVPIIRSLGQCVVTFNEKSTVQLERLISTYVMVCNTVIKVMEKNDSPPKKSRIYQSQHLNVTDHEYDVIRDLQIKGAVFLCHISPLIRVQAINILQIAKKMNLLLNRKKTDHLIDLINQIGVGDFKNPSYEELRKGNLRSDKRHTSKQQEDFDLSYIASSDLPSHAVLWKKYYDQVIEAICSKYPEEIKEIQIHIHKRFLACHQQIVSIYEQKSFSTNRSGQTIKWTNVNTQMTTQKTYLVPLGNESDELVLLWGHYILSLALMSSDYSNSSRPSHPVMKDVIRSVIPFIIHSEKHHVRQAVVQGLSCIHYSLFYMLMEDIRTILDPLLEDLSKRRIGTSRKDNYIRTDLLLLLSKIIVALKHEPYCSDSVLIQYLLTIIKVFREYFNDSENVLNWDCVIQKMYYCQFLDNLHSSLLQSPSSKCHIAFGLRWELFCLLEEWSGFGPHRDTTRDKEARMMSHILEQVKDMRERGLVTNLMEEQRKALETATLSALVCLCKGFWPPGDSAAVKAMNHVLDWISSLFANPDERLFPLAQNAVAYLLEYNVTQTRLIERMVEMCYGSRNNRTVLGHMNAFVDVISKAALRIDLHVMITLCLFKLIDSNRAIRIAALKVLEMIEARHLPEESVFVKRYALAVENDLPIIVIRAHEHISYGWAERMPALTLEVYCEALIRLQNVYRGGEKDLFQVMIPWLKNVELKLDSQGQFDYISGVTLHNLLYITLKYMDDYMEYVSKLWSALSVHSKNIYAIVAFLILVGTEKKNPDFLPTANRIIVYLGRTDVKADLVELLLSQLMPKSVVPKQNTASLKAIIDQDRYYFADIEPYLPETPKKPSFSTGQLSAIFLVDLFVEHPDSLTNYLAMLLHMVFIHLDHFNMPVYENHFKLLVHILICVPLEPPQRAQAMDLVEKIRKSGLGKRLWLYEDLTPDIHDLVSCEKMYDLLSQVISILEPVYVDLPQQWGVLSLQWATTCPVRHLACRSLQLFRIVEPEFNIGMMCDLVARLSNTLAEEKSLDIQGFALEIIFTFHSLIKTLPLSHPCIPILFFCCCACLSSPLCHEIEFTINALNLLFCNKEIQSTDLDMWKTHISGMPTLFDRLVPALLFNSIQKLSLDLLLEISRFPSHPLIFSNPEHDFIIILITFLPHFVQYYDGTCTVALTRLVEAVISLAKSHNKEEIVSFFQSLTEDHFKKGADFLRQFKAVYLREFESKARSVDVMSHLFLLSWNGMSLLNEFVAEIFKEFSSKTGNLTTRSVEGWLQNTECGNDLVLSLLMDGAASGYSKDVDLQPFPRLDASTPRKQLELISKQFRRLYVNVKENVGKALKRISSKDRLKRSTSSIKLFRQSFWKSDTTLEEEDLIDDDVKFHDVLSKLQDLNVFFTEEYNKLSELEKEDESIASPTTDVPTRTEQDEDDNNDDDDETFIEESEMQTLNKKPEQLAPISSNRQSWKVSSRKGSFDYLDFTSNGLDLNDQDLMIYCVFALKESERQSNNVWLAINELALYLDVPNSCLNDKLSQNNLTVSISRDESVDMVKTLAKLQEMVKHGPSAVSQALASLLDMSSTEAIKTFIKTGDGVVPIDQLSLKRERSVHGVRHFQPSTPIDEEAIESTIDDDDETLTSEAEDLVRPRIVRWVQLKEGYSSRPIEDFSIFVHVYELLLFLFDDTLKEFNRHSNSIGDKYPQGEKRMKRIIHNLKYLYENLFPPVATDKNILQDLQTKVSLRNSNQAWHTDSLKIVAIIHQRLRAMLTARQTAFKWQSDFESSKAEPETSIKLHLSFCVAAATFASELILFYDDVLSFHAHLDSYVHSDRIDREKFEALVDETFDFSEQVLDAFQSLLDETEK